MAISNKTLAILLVVAIVISVGGAMISIAQITTLVNVIPALKGITGFGTTGTVNVSISSIASLNVTQTYVDFGVGSVKGTYAGAKMNSSSDNPCDSTNWTSDAGSCVPKDIRIQNVGTKDLRVDMRSGKVASSMLGGGAPYYQFSGENTTATSGCLNNMQNLTEFTGSASLTQNVCDNLTRLTGFSEMNVSIVLIIPYDAPAGNKTDTLTFNVTEAT